MNALGAAYAGDDRPCRYPAGGTGGAGGAGEGERRGGWMGGCIAC
jgi:hypothetical protein